MPWPDLHLDRTMLTGALAGLRGPLCLRLASAFNHRLEWNNHAYYRRMNAKTQEVFCPLERIFAFFFKKSALGLAGNLPGQSLQALAAGVKEQFVARAEAVQGGMPFDNRLPIPAAAPPA